LAGPTGGLHSHDVKKLLDVLHELVEQGNTVVVIEHNLEVIKTADWIIDLGPEGGDGGGEIVAAGTPEDIVKAKRSYTGQFLAPVLSRRDAKRKPRTEAAEGRSSSNPRQRALGVGGGRPFHQRLAVEHDLVTNLAAAGKPRALALGDELRHRHGHVDLVADLDRGAEIERLRDVDGAGAGKARAQHRRDQARGVEA